MVIVSDFEFCTCNWSTNLQSTVQHLVEQLALIDIWHCQYIIPQCHNIMYEALQDQSTAVPIPAHMALWYILAVPYIN